jgi:HlyD family secretion protein
MTEAQRKWLFRSTVMLLVAVLAVLAWQRYGANNREAGLVSGNGRIEAVEIDVASKIAWSSPTSH